MLELKTADLDDYDNYQSPLTVTPSKEIRLFPSEDQEPIYKIKFTIPSETDVTPRTNAISMSVDFYEIEEVVLSVVNKDEIWTEIDTKVPHLPLKLIM